MANINTQVTLVFQCMKSKIARAIVAQCRKVAVVKYVCFDKVKLLATDFNEDQIPAIQLIDVGMTAQPEQVRTRKSWQIALELLMRKDQYKEVSQEDLWNLENEVLRKVFADPKLGIPGMITMTLLGSTTDLHLLDPYYISRIDIQVDFYEGLVRDC